MILQKGQEWTEFLVYVSKINAFNLDNILYQESKCFGPVVPDNPLDDESDYICLDCGHSSGWKYVSMQMRNAEHDLKTPNNKYDLIHHLEQFIYNKSTILHPSNYIMISVKQKLGSLYGNCSPYEYKNMNIPMIQRKIQV